MKSKEFLLSYGGLLTVIFSALLLMSYFGFFFFSNEPTSKLSKLQDLEEEIQIALAENTLDLTQQKLQTPDYFAEIRKYWEQPTLAKAAPKHMVYPAIGISFNRFEDEQEKKEIAEKLTQRFLVLEPKEASTYFGPLIRIRRSMGCGGPIEVTSAQILKVAQQKIDQIKIEWDDTNPEMAAQAGIEEYQLWRIEGEKKEKVRCLTPKGYQEKSFVDKNFKPTTEYTYYVISKASRVSRTDLPLPLKAEPSNKVSIQTRPDFEIFFSSLIKGGGRTFARVNIYKFYQGKWYKAGFQVRPGEVIGEKRKIKTKGGQKVILDFTTPFEVYDFFMETREINRVGRTSLKIEQPRLVCFDRSKSNKRMTLWKFNSIVDLNPYEK